MTPSSPPSVERCSRTEARALAVKALVGAGLDQGTAERWAEACHAAPERLATLAAALDEPAALPFLQQAPALAELEYCGVEALWPDGTDEALKLALFEPPPDTDGPIAIDRVTLDRLKRHAEHTLVPVGADSLANAGAGLTDND